MNLSLHGKSQTRVRFECCSMTRLSITAFVSSKIDSTYKPERGVPRDPEIAPHLKFGDGRERPFSSLCGAADKVQGKVVYCYRLLGSATGVGSQRVR